MPDWFMYELDNIRWDEVGETDDHIVPHPATTEQGNWFLGQGCSREKARCGVVSVVRKNEGSKSVAIDGIQGREGTCCPSVKDIKAPMLQKDSWSSSPDGVFLDSGNAHLIQENAGFSCNDARLPNNCVQRDNTSLSGNELSENVTYENRGTETDSSSRWFQLDNMSPTGNDLKFLANELEEKDCTDLLYYGWPDVGNFQEANRMFRSRDFTFGQGISNYDNEVSWLSSSSSSSCAIGGSEDAFISNFNSPLPVLKSTSKQSERNIKFMCDSLSPTSTNYEKQNGFDTYSMNAQTLNANDSFTQGLCYHKLLDADFEDRRISISNEQAEGFNGGIEINISPITQISSENGGMINLQRKSNAGHQSEGEREDHSLEYLNGGSFHGSGMRQQIEYTSSYALHHSLPMEMSTNSSMKALALALEERIENVNQHQQMQSTMTNVSQSEDSMAKQAIATRTDLVPTKKQLQQVHDGVGGHSEAERVIIDVPAEVDSSAKESHSMSMLLDDVSLEGESSFRHLQCIMKQLDIRTKLCIRDSLYRLARSAEQRHNLGNSNSSGIENRDDRGLLTTEEANVSSGFMDSEADTNPIDRSVAHLLFQSPSDPSPRPSNDSLFLEPSSMIHGSITSQHLMPSEVLYMKEISGGAQEVAEY